MFPEAIYVKCRLGAIYALNLKQNKKSKKVKDFKF